MVLMGFLLLGMFVFARKQPSSLLNNGSSQPKTETMEETSASIDARKTATRTQREGIGLAAGKASQQPATNDENTPLAQHQTYVEKRIEELTDLAMNDDSSSLDTILSELTNRDPQIRKAALEATIQFGSRDAIPKLADVVSQVDDPGEKHDILEAIEFLKLPSASEVIAQAGGASKKAMKTRPAPLAPASLKK